MDKVKRYDVIWSHDDNTVRHAVDDGEYVLYEDYDKLRAELDAAIRERDGAVRTSDDLDKQLTDWAWVISKLTSELDRLRTAIRTYCRCCQLEAGDDCCHACNFREWRVKA